MKLATWNVNSLNVRLPHVLDWLAASPVDVLCLQETKLVDQKFPREALREAGYASAFAGQPTYNGVALLSRLATAGEPDAVVIGNPHFEDEQKRLIAASYGALRVICAYFPNGQAVGSEKFAYKLEWIDALARWVAEERAAHTQFVLAGDFNIAPDDRDVHDPEAWAGAIHCSEPERERFRELVELGLADAFRLFEQPPATFSWWDYRQGAFRRNAGLRIDHVLLSAALRERARGCFVDKGPRKLQKPSDHAPVVVELAD
ncbi:MAG: exodeoxyribonuclease III [Burkholderiales bacterium]|nr:MAG: exodeoxyribonuclease III [Burkholderiales bacterium]